MTTVLADTNIWCDFLSGADLALAPHLEHDFLIIHPLVIGELAAGSLPSRQQTLADLSTLPQLRAATFEEALRLVETHELFGRGLQWNDLLILASVITSPGTALWMRNKRLAEVAGRFGVGFNPQ